MHIFNRITNCIIVIYFDFSSKNEKSEKIIPKFSLWLCCLAFVQLRKCKIITKIQNN